MTDSRIFGAAVSGPTTAISFGSANGSVGLEFYVNQPVYLKYVHQWRNNSQLNRVTPFILYLVTSSTAGQEVVGGRGSIPAGNGGWIQGQANPVLLTPGNRYKISLQNMPYSAYTNDQFYKGQKYASGVGNSVIFAPGEAQTLSGNQGTYASNSGYPNTDYSDTNWWIDITVTDAGFPTPLKLGASGTVGKKTAATAVLNLGASGVSVKRSIQNATAYLNLRASGRSFTSDSLVGTARLTLGASGVVTRQASIPGTAELQLGGSGTVSKSTEVGAIAELKLGAPTPTDFWRGVADGVRDALLEHNWNPDRRHFQEASQVDAEALPADVLGGLFALSIGDHERAHETIRHLRTFRVKGQQIAGGHYRNTCTMIGYKPYGALGAQGHVSPPQVIDQAWTWLAEIFKGNYGEPIGDDVRSLINWHYSWITAGPSALYGAQFLGVNRTIWNANYKVVSRPTLAAAAWGYLAASGSSLLFPVDALPRPQIPAVELSTSPIGDGARHRLDFAWTVADRVPATVYENRLQSRTDRYGPWNEVFEHQSEYQSDTIEQPDGSYAHVITVPQPSVTTQFRVLVRMRNALYGEWTTSNTVQIYSHHSAVFPGPTTFPSPTLFPQG